MSKNCILLRKKRCLLMMTLWLSIAWVYFECSDQINDNPLDWNLTNWIRSHSTLFTFKILQIYFASHFSQVQNRKVLIWKLPTKIFIVIFSMKWFLLSCGPIKQHVMDFFPLLRLIKNHRPVSIQAIWLGVPHTFFAYWISASVIPWKFSRSIDSVVATTHRWVKEHRTMNSK